MPKKLSIAMLGLLAWQFSGTLVGSNASAVYADDPPPVVKRVILVDGVGQIPQ